MNIREVYATINSGGSDVNMASVASYIKLGDFATNVTYIKREGASIANGEYNATDNSYQVYFSDDTNPIASGSFIGGYSVIWFVLIYLLGAIIKKYNFSKLFSKKNMVNYFIIRIYNNLDFKNHIAFF